MIRLVMLTWLWLSVQCEVDDAIVKLAVVQLFSWRIDLSMTL